MKRLIVALLTMITVLTGCSQNKVDNNNQSNAIQDTIKVPDKSNVTNEQIAKDISDSIKKDFEVKETESNLKALEIVAETEKVIGLIDKNKDKEAREEMAKLIGNLEILITKDPNVVLVPLGSEYAVNDVVIDVETAKQIIKDARKAMKDGYYQTAKELLDGLTSEYNIVTTYLPVGTYPDAMKLASAKLDDKKSKEAKEILLQALNTLVIKEENIPMPVLKAEEFISLAAVAMAGTEKNKKDVANVLLDNADYQLKLAEVMGYGRKDKEFKELAKAIKSLKKAVNKDEETKTMFEDLSKKIKNFKERLFFKKNKK